MKSILGGFLLALAATGTSLVFAGPAEAAADFSDVIVCVRTTAEFSDGTIGVYCTNG